MWITHPLALGGTREACYRSPDSVRGPTFRGWASCAFADSSPEGPHFCFSFSEATSIQDTTKRVRVNRMIRISPVRVIGADGLQLGILEVDAALRMAEEAGLDLVEVAATARPPVVRIMDYGKFKFEMAKQARVA